MRFEDARRLTGPNLLAQGPLVLAELLPDSESKEVVLAAYAAELNRFRAALGLPNVAPRIAREARGWLGVVFEAPLDEMMAGAESAEWAGLSAVEVLAGRPALPLEPKLTEVTAIIARDRNPRLLEVHAEANARGLPFLWDDESVSVGQGRRSVTFPLHAIPSTIDWSALGAVPIAMITGTNGKTTSTRLLARMAAEASRSVGMSCSDGVTLGTQQVREGDWTGPAAARVVLRSREVDFAVLETARGGILRRGLAVEACDAALITNITDDHLGTYGVDDLEGMTEVKAVVARAVRPGGVVVLNARDPRLVALAPTLDAQVIYFADLDREPSAVIDAHRGRAVVARDGEFIELNNGVARSLLPVRSAPITFKGAARYNVENALGAAAMALGLGLSQAAVVRALSSFGAGDNPGRGETYERDGVTLFLDFAHNPDGVASALAVANSLRRDKTSKLTVISGSAGDRTEREVESICDAIKTSGTQRVFLREIAGYLRGREPGVMQAFFRKALSERGFSNITDVANEVEGLEAALRESQAGDVIALLVHVEREAVHAWLTRAPTTGASAVPQS